MHVFWAVRVRGFTGSTLHQSFDRLQLPDACHAQLVGELLWLRDYSAGR